MPRQMPSARAVVPPLAALALALGAVAGCGDAGDQVLDRDATLQLTLDEYRILPKNIRVRPGRVHIVARNAGRLTHNVVVESFTNSPETDEAVEFGRTQTSHPGETVSEIEDITLKPGKYRLLCSIANHDDLGQYAILRVSRK